MWAKQASAGHLKFECRSVIGCAAFRILCVAIVEYWRSEPNAGQWRNDVTAAALWGEVCCNAGFSNEGPSLCVRISREWSYPLPIYRYTRTAIDCATTLPLTVFVDPMHWIDPLISFFRLSVSQSVCVPVNRSVVERLHPQFFTDFHEILHAAHKCGCFVAYCLWDKQEVVCRFKRCVDSNFGSFQALVATFFNRSAPNPIYR